MTVVWFYAPGADVSVGGDPSVPRSRESTEEDLNAPRFSTPDEDEPAPVPRTSDPSVSLGPWRAESGTFMHPPAASSHHC